ncbi:DUF1992 domain-containing protein [Thermosyntropha sp.]|uniref:DnaJ family domain-containing protein n=1 Tax=Thermosyntropha sp. TaxID=2740820 RepID=UPI0025D18B82|nr:DUF1992 domain-containing protein [Thermosyntropha sp.]MBO8159951.1 DUF1992 domain-containing protein [Thermosyntropha sp.]
MGEKSYEEEVKIKAEKSRHLARYMSSVEDLVELQIEKAMKRGEFDNLKGAGKPIDFYENPYEPPELRMMFKILKNNNFAPYWVELGKEIDADMEKLKREIEYFKKYVRMFFGEKRSLKAYKNFERKKAHFYYESRLTLERISQKINDYNLHCPTFRENRANIVIDDEMYKIITAIEEEIKKFK